MDVFKLLSKSAKPAPSSPAQKLPSSGAAVNPQLFGHDEKPNTAPTPGSKSSRKRKRGQNAAAEEEAPLPADIDFFSGVPSEGKKNKKRKGKAGDGNEEGVNGAEAQDGAEKKEEKVTSEEEPYDEDECKRVLRSHKLKIVVLENHNVEEAPEPEPEIKEKKKSKKKRKLEEEAAKEKVRQDKKHKKQLWPRPLSSFGELRTRYGISRRLALNVEEQGYKMPTEVQLGTLPLLMGNKEKVVKSEDASGEYLDGDIDLLTVAPTGSGKTIAFTIPIINGLLKDAHRATEKTDEGIRAVILAPTRELASQIVNETRKLAKGTGIKAALMKKGMELVERPEEEENDGVDETSEHSEGEEDVENEASESENDEGVRLAQPKKKRRRAAVTKTAILVATPLALLNALKLKDGTVSPLPTVHYLVLDEADVLLDPLFREQTLAVWNACTNPLLRVGLWSATMGSNIESLAVDTLNSRWNSLSATVPRPPLVRAVVGLKDTAIPNITHKLIYAATEQGKLLGLRQLLHPTAISSDTAPALRPPFLVFTQTIPRAIALHSELLYDIPPEAGGSSRIAVLHANLSSAARGDVMTRFRRGEVWVLITTDLLARGVDFRGLNGVVNYDVPNSAAAYVHRVGRTGRAGREGGVAVTYYTQEDIPYIKNVANVIRASEKLRAGAGAEDGSVKQWLLDALPTPSKRDKQNLKKRGVEARRTTRGKDDEGRTKARISTKSGYERRKENNIRGAKMAARRGGGKKEERAAKGSDGGEGSDFEGFGDE